MKTVGERFWEKVDKHGPDECWNWTAALQGNGYGYFRLSKDVSNIVAHRYSYMEVYGSIPDGMLVCHTCDNPKCVNPKHLFLGTHSDNAKDREKKGRGNRPHSKLSEQEVVVIKSSTESQSKLASLYDVSRRTIASIQYGETWKTIERSSDIQTEDRCCTICGETTTKSIHVDMNYQFRKINDLLCLRCDKALKLFDGNITLLEKAVEFLRPLIP